MSETPQAPAPEAAKKRQRKVRPTAPVYPVIREMQHPLLKHSYYVPQQLACRHDLSMGAKLLYGVLRSYECRREAYPPVEYLARDLGLGRHRISDLICELEDLGLIKVTRRGAHHRPNLFQFTDHPWLHEPRPLPADPPDRGRWRRGPRATHERVAEPSPAEHACEILHDAEAGSCTTAACGDLHDERVVHVGVVQESRSTAERDRRPIASRSAAPTESDSDSRSERPTDQDRPTAPAPVAAGSAAVGSAVPVNAQTATNATGEWGDQRLDDLMKHPVGRAWVLGRVGFDCTDDLTDQLLSDGDISRLVNCFNGDVAIAARWISWVLAPEMLARLRNESSSRKAMLRPHWRPAVAWVCGLSGDQLSYRQEFIGAMAVEDLAAKWIAHDRLHIAENIYPVVKLLKLRTGREHQWPEDLASELAEAIVGLKEDWNFTNKDLFDGIGMLPTVATPRSAVAHFVAMKEQLASGELSADAAREAARTSEGSSSLDAT